MLFRKKLVLCTNCGFFCWHVQHVSGEGPFRLVEISKRFRQEFQSGREKGGEDDDEYYNVSCIRGQWIWSPSFKGTLDYVDAEGLQKPRKCLFYMNYQPGFGPEEHKMLKRESDTARDMRKATLIGAVIGAVAAILAQMLYMVFTR
jgi:hypothetical protein